MSGEGGVVFRLDPVVHNLILLRIPPLSVHRPRIPNRRVLFFRIIQFETDNPYGRVNSTRKSHEHNNPHTMSYFRITLRRSAIGLPARKNGVLASLGLRKRMQTVYHAVSPDIAGKIMSVKELLEVQETEVALDKKQEKALRTPPKGYVVEKATV
ncbi:hypothetical protein BJ508DRAFT_364460 [Ascobolus immersus RN42]|uniref:Large ribosomal subunit protein uL30m n=1 Tax=Ascobolus immersus RN42 TaxID=1160509 RepID=A0A3N4HU55_ASCIM|nr:hypothetical protein BJ508DRAFT_364460 [Ascobolus immersus RN42]